MSGQSQPVETPNYSELESLWANCVGVPAAVWMSLEAYRFAREKYPHLPEITEEMIEAGVVQITEGRVDACWGLP